VLVCGIRDERPSLPRIPRRWGRAVLHGPDDHGYELAQRPLGVLNITELSPLRAQLIAKWGPTTVFLDR
jgi:hypothetical protein